MFFLGEQMDFLLIQVLLKLALGNRSLRSCFVVMITEVNNLKDYSAAAL